MIIICIYCRNEFYSKNKTRKYCSRKCYHSSRCGFPTWNKGLTKEENESLLQLGINSGKTRRERYKNGELIVWNKGLTKTTDHRVKKISTNHANLHGPLNPFYGKKHTPDTKHKLSKRRLGKSYIEMFGKERADKILSKLSNSLSGEKNPRFNGWVSKEPYHKCWTKELKQYILDRDNYQCQNATCWHNSNRLTVHHIDYDKKNCSAENLITLCASCNSRANKNRSQWEEYYRGKTYSRFSVAVG